MSPASYRAAPPRVAVPLLYVEAVARRKSVLGWSRMVGMDPSKNPALTQALIELEQHVARDGWDQGVRLFALVDTAELIAAEPRLAAALAPETVEFGGRIGPLRTYTSIEQEGVPADRPLDEL